MANLTELKASREEKMSKIDALMETAKTSALSPEQKKLFDDMEAEVATIDKDIAFEEKLEAKRIARAAEKFTSTPSRVNDPALPGAPQDNASEYKEMGKLASRFSVSKGLNIAFESKVHDGAEKEVYDMAKAEAKASDVQLSGNFAIPHAFIKIGKRSALTVATEGTDVVFTDYGGKIIPYLNPEPVAEKLGVTFLQGLRGDIKWPRTSNRLSLGFTTESGSVSETTPTLDSISMTPKRFGGYVDYTMHMQRQSVFNTDTYLKNQLNIAYEYLIDDQTFNGSGSGNQTTGILNTSGVGVLSTGSGSANDMTYKALLSMKRDAKVANARRGKAGWVTNTYGEFALFNTPMQASGVEGNFILKPDYNGRFIGDPFLTSEMIPANLSEGGQTDLCAIIYSSNWGGLLVGFWGGLDLTFDPYTQKVAGANRIIVNGFMDIDVEQPAEFTYCKDWDASDLPALT